MELDSTDKELLHALDLDARRPVTSVAEEIGRDRETCRYRLRRLEDQGLIKRYLTILDASKLGMTTFRVQFAFNALSQALEAEIKNALLEGCYWLVRVRGEWDFNTLFQAEDPKRFKSFLDTFKSDYGECLHDYRADLITDIHHFRRDLTRSSTSKEVRVWGDDTTSVDLDATDRCILETVQNRARLSAVDIADACDVSPRVVRYRLESYEESNLLLGYRPALSLERLDLSHVKVELKLQECTDRLRDRLFEFLRTRPRLLVYVTEAIGGPDFEFELYVEDTAELYQVIDGLREEFTEHLVDWSWIEYTEEPKLNYLHQL